MGFEIAQALLAADTSNDDTVQEVVTDTINYAIIAAGVGVGVVVGLLLTAIIVYLVKAFSREQRLLRIFLRHARTPFAFTNAFWFGHLGLSVVQDQAKGAAWLEPIDHTLIVLSIAAAAWMLVAGAHTIDDAARQSARRQDAQRASRVRTQALMIRRIVQGAVILLGIAAIAMTFPAARTAIASVLASAGVASIVATLAAQSMLANVFAGFQIAMTDSLRVGDIIVVSGLDGPKVQGTVEEITLTYVVLHVWDGRRLVIPSSKLTTNEFENLSRRQSEMIASIELYLDYRAPVAQIRAELDTLLAASDLWDGEDANVQVTAATDHTMTVRIVVSAKDPATAWDLGCSIREDLLTWIARELPYALPRARYQPLEVEHVEHDISEEKVADLAQELANISGPGLGHGRTRLTPTTAEREQAAITDQQLADAPTSVLPQGAAAAAGATKGAKQAPSGSTGTEGEGADATAAAANTGRTSDQVEHDARLRAAKSRARRAIQRRSILPTPPTPSRGDTQHAADTEGDIPTRPIDPSDLPKHRATPTRPVSSADAADTAETPSADTDHPLKHTGIHHTGSRLYSGSPRAEERGRIFSATRTMPVQTGDPNDADRSHESDHADKPRTHDADQPKDGHTD
ncbi:MAG: mechanosensitive ion channel [Actinomycetaceae bacterium]|nr:mechanosensitive ion channel [Actinomycetaceae bacterium]MDU0970621.1 mechanosensitive ion channel [Actinomycetaceae bacterium]